MNHNTVRGKVDHGVSLAVAILMSLVLAEGTLAQPLPPRSGVVEIGPMMEGEVKAAEEGEVEAPWGQDVKVNTDAGVSPQNETTIAANPKDKLNLVGGPMIIVWGTGVVAFTPPWMGEKPGGMA